MEEKLITLAIHTKPKARILEDMLIDEGHIPVFKEEVDGDPSKVRIRVREEDLNKALTISENKNLFNYSDEQITKIDDGKRRILVAVDFSKYSLQACHVAFVIARNIDAKVKILHVYNNVYFPLHIPFADTLKDEGDQSILDKARKNMLDLCYTIDEKIKNKEFPSINYSYSIREGIPQEEVELFVKEYRPALLVVGTKGSNNSENIIGSVAADIIEMTNIPILAIPEKLTVDKIENVNHFSFLSSLEKKDLNSFKTFLELIRPYNESIKITVIHISTVQKEWDKNNENMNSMKEYFKEQYPNLNIHYKLIEGQDTLSALLKFIEEDNVDLIALNAQRRNLFRRMFSPSISRKVLSQSNVILLALRG